MANAEETFEFPFDIEEGVNINDTEIQKEYECLKGGLDVETTGLYCPHFWDTVLCWPRTPAGTLALLPCFEEFHGIKYDTSQNASRFCHSNGTWDNYTDYTACRDMVHGDGPEPGIIEMASTLYFIGYAISLIALIIAVWIFLYFQDLRCLRNTIHTNLMFTYIFADFFWILTLTLQISFQEATTSCIVLVIALHYFHLTNLFWMFVEGLYLYMLVVETFTGENIKLRVYIVIGWILPIIIVSAWAIVKGVAPTIPQPEAAQAQTGSELGKLSDCAWWNPHSYDWIYQGPAVLVLAVNCVFLFMIMWVLITKLRATNNAETQQYRKATKALLVLIPLLGVTYILVIIGPKEGLFATVFDFLRPLLLSTQGFTVALFYCFLNAEVRNAVRHHVERWKTARTLGGSRRYTYSSKDWSPRSRTESIRLSIRTSNASGIGVTAATAITTPTFGPTLMVENAV